MKCALHHKDPGCISALRTRLWRVNAEYSALARKSTEEETHVRMAELRSERLALMALIASARAQAGWLIHRPR